MKSVADLLLEKSAELLALTKKWQARSPVWCKGDRAYLDVEMHRLFRRIELHERLESLSEEETATLRSAESILEEVSVLLWD